jgi:non-ribosomal peptide synthetase component F
VFDLNLQVYEEPADLRASWQYASRLFRAESVARFRDSWLDIVDAVLADPVTPLGTLPRRPGGAPDQPASRLPASVPAIEFDW